jgi:hypothetical protein
MKMRKKVFMATIVVTILAVSGWNVSQSKSDAILSDVTLVNVEALAAELPEITITCGYSEGQCWRSYFSHSGMTCYCEFTVSQSDYCLWI